MKTFKTLVCPQPDKVVLIDRSLPNSLADDQLLVRNTHGVEKHGTMQSFVHKHGNSRGAWDNERLMHTPGEGVVWNYPIPLGNMQIGYVENKGPGAADFKVGDRVVYFGGFAPYGIAYPGRAWKIGEDTPWQSAGCLDPATFALCAIRDAKLRIGDAVAVFSLGAIGLTAVALAKLAGASPIVAIDPIEKRREVATKLGADIVIDPIGKDVGEMLREITAWRGVDVVIEYSGAVPALNAAVRGVAFGGTIACGAFPGPYPAGLDFGGEAHMNRPNIVFTRTESDPNRDHPNWDNARVRDTVMKMINEGKIDGVSIVDPIIPFSDKLPEEYEAIMADDQNSVKMGLSY